MRVLLLKHFFVIVLFLLTAIPLLAQDNNPVVEIVLSTEQAQLGDTIYADVFIRNGEAIAGADIGIATDSCLRVVERQPGNYLPSSSENGGFSPFEELSDSGTRFAASIIDRTRIANGDGVFFRAALEVICEEATSVVVISFAELAALSDPDSASNELLGYSLQQGNITVVTDSLVVRQGAVVSTPQAIRSISSPANSPDTNIFYLAVALLAFSGIGLMVLFMVFLRRKKQGNRARP
jgi:hypothetical protein